MKRKSPRRVDRSRGARPDAPHRSERRATILVVLGIVVLAGALHLPALEFPFLWDDAMMLDGRVDASDPSVIADAFTGHYLASISDANRQTPYYRPLSLALLLTERWLFGPTPRAFHLIHGALHLLGGLLLFLVIRGALTAFAAIDRRAATLGAGFGAALFLVLPYGIDAVLFLTNVGDLMVLVALLGALICFERFHGRRSLPALLGVAACGAVAVFAKETGAVVPLVLVLRLLLDPDRARMKRALVGLGAALLPVIGYLVLRAQMIADPAPFELGAALYRLPSDLAVSLRWALLPHPLALREPVKGLELGGWWWAGLVLLGLAAAAVVRWRRRRPLVVAVLLAWLVLLAPALAGLQGSLSLAPRYLFVPGAALALGFGLLFCRSRRPVRFALGALVIAGLLLAVIRVDAWSDARTFWALEVERHPEQAASLISLGRTIEKRGEVDAAAALYERAIAAADADGHALYGSLARTNYGRLRDERFGDPDGALGYLAEAAELFATEDVWLVTGLVHARQRSYPRAIAAFEKGLELAPDSYGIHLAISGALAALGRFDEALAHLDRCAEVAGGSPEALAEVKRRRDLLLRIRSQLEEGRRGATRSR